MPYNSQADVVRFMAEQYDTKLLLAKKKKKKKDGF